MANTMKNKKSEMSHQLPCTVFFVLSMNVKRLGHRCQRSLVLSRVHRTDSQIRVVYSMAGVNGVLFKQLAIPEISLTAQILKLSVCRFRQSWNVFIRCSTV